MQIYKLVSYFVYHPKMQMQQFVDGTDRAILGSCIKRMAAKGLSEDDIKKAIDKFYASPAGTARRPVLPFINKGFQEQLTAGMSHTNLSKDQSINDFIANGFERTADMDLIWDEEWDIEIKSRVMRDPDAVMDIIEEYM